MSERKGNIESRLVTLIAGIVSGFFFSSGNVFTIFNQTYRAVLMFNLQYASTLALIYFAWRQYRFTQLEHADASFEITEAKVEPVSSRISSDRKSIEEIGSIVAVSFKIKNTGEGYVDNLDIMRANLMVSVEPEDGLFTMYSVTPQFSKEFVSRIKPGEERKIRIEEFSEAFNEQELNEKIDPEMDYSFDNFSLRFFSDKGKHVVSTENVELDGKDVLV